MAAAIHDALVGFQRWRDLLFVHWELPEAVLRALIPPALTIDTYQGKAYVGLLPFDIPEIRPLRALPGVPTAARFLETNLRTYVRHGDASGIWFFSLDAGSSLAVLGARVAFGLPYHRADLRAERSGDVIDYRSQRLWPRPAAALTVRYQIGAALGPAQPGTLEHFLVERYVLYSQHPLGLLEQRIRHHPYLLHAATVTELDESLLAAAGIVGRGARTPDWFSPGVDVELLPPSPVRG